MVKKYEENWFTGGFKILFNSIKLYLCNFETFLKLLAFPVLGQMLGLFLIFTVNYLFIMNVPQLAKTNTIFNNITFVFTLLILTIVPCFLIFAKAFLDYIVLIASSTLMANHILDKEKLKDAEIHKDIVKVRLGGYFGLIIILSLIFSLLAFPLFWVLLLPVAILLSLSIQAYILEDDISVFSAMRRSWLFVRYNFFKTLFLLLFLFVICYLFLPAVFNWLVDKTNLNILLSNPIELYINLLPLDDINSRLIQFPFLQLSLQNHEISLFIIESVIAFCVVGFTLPLRVIACCDLYRELRGKNIIRDDTGIKKIVKRAQAK